MLLRLPECCTRAGEAALYHNWCEGMMHRRVLPASSQTSFLLSSTPWIMKPSKCTVQLRVPQAGDGDVMNWLQLCPDLQTVCQKTWVMSGVMWRGSKARNLTVNCPPGVYHCGEVVMRTPAQQLNNVDFDSHKTKNQIYSILWSWPLEKYTALWFISCTMNPTAISST